MTAPKHAAPSVFRVSSLSLPAQEEKDADGLWPQYNYVIDALLLREGSGPERHEVALLNRVHLKTNTAAERHEIAHRVFAFERGGSAIFPFLRGLTGLSYGLLHALLNMSADQGLRLSGRSLSALSAETTVDSDTRRVAEHLIRNLKSVETLIADVTSAIESVAELAAIDFADAIVPDPLVRLIIKTEFDVETHPASWRLQRSEPLSSDEKQTLLNRVLAERPDDVGPRISSAWAMLEAIEDDDLRKSILRVAMSAYLLESLFCSPMFGRKEPPGPLDLLIELATSAISKPDAVRGWLAIYQEESKSQMTERFNLILSSALKGCPETLYPNIIVAATLPELVDSLVAMQADFEPSGNSLEEIYATDARYSLFSYVIGPDDKYYHLDVNMAFLTWLRPGATSRRMSAAIAARCPEGVPNQWWKLLAFLESIRAQLLSPWDDAGVACPFRGWGMAEHLWLDLGCPAESCVIRRWLSVLRDQTELAAHHGDCPPSEMPEVYWSQWRERQQERGGPSGDGPSDPGPDL